jgi:aconitate hydratase
VLAGKEYGSGSSRDWAAKGPALQGVRAVIAESFERIHRSNLVGMGIVPLQFRAGETPRALGLDGRETFEILGLARRDRERASRPAARSACAPRARTADDRVQGARVRIDTPQEVQYVQHGGILQYVLRRLLAGPR